MCFGAIEGDKDVSPPLPLNVQNRRSKEAIQKPTELTERE